MEEAVKYNICQENRDMEKPPTLIFFLSCNWELSLLPARRFFLKMSCSCQLLHLLLPGTNLCFLGRFQSFTWLLQGIHCWIEYLSYLLSSCISYHRTISESLKWPITIFLNFLEIRLQKMCVCAHVHTCTSLYATIGKDKN
jgi:hypothetical protein